MTDIGKLLNHILHPLTNEDLAKLDLFTIEEKAYKHGDRIGIPEENSMNVKSSRETFEDIDKVYNFVLQNSGIK